MLAFQSAHTDCKFSSLNLESQIKTDENRIKEIYGDIELGALLSSLAVKDL